MVWLPSNLSMFFSCCGRQDRIGNESIHFDGSERMLQSNPIKESNMCCGIGIAFKPDTKGTLIVKRLITGGSAELSGAVQVIILAQIRFSRPW